MQDLSQQEIKSIINYFKNIKSIKIEGNKILYRNQSQIDFLGTMIIGLGLLCCVIENAPLLFLRIIIGIAICFGGVVFIKKYRSYAVLDLTFKTIYTEYRLGDTVLRNCDKTALSDIVAVGMDHKRKKPMKKDTALMRMILKAVDPDWTPLKNTSPIDGCLEATSIAYITKTGEKKYFCEFSDKVDADVLCENLAEAIANIIDVKPCIAAEKKCLAVKKTGNQYRFDAVAIKADFIGSLLESLRDFALIGIIVIIVIAIIVCLV